MFDITIHAGADMHIKIKLRDQDGQLISDIDESEISSQLREFQESNNAFVFVPSYDAEEGIITLYMPYEETERIGFTRGVYDVFVTLPSGLKQKIMEGAAYIDRNVTRSGNNNYSKLIHVLNESNLPVEGKMNRIYKCMNSNNFYIWAGTGYTQLVPAGE